MRRIVLAGAVFFFFMLLAIPGTAATASLKAEAIRKLQSAVVKALPAEGSIIRIAILDLAGDDGAVKNAITAIITEKTSFKVIERADLDMILKEQGLQLKDVMDEKTRIQHGKLKGVQGLLMGKVLGMESGFMSYTVRIHLKLDDVEKGEIVFARDFNVTAVSPVRAWIFIIAGLVLLIIVVAIVWGRRRSAIKETVIQADVKERVDLGRPCSFHALRGAGKTDGSGQDGRGRGAQGRGAQSPGPEGTDRKRGARFFGYEDQGGAQ
jgi:curli biogenesis system outer membrane secretion channel CsgG